LGIIDEGKCNINLQKNESDDFYVALKSRAIKIKDVFAQ
jgi:hypothetical protein